jgi:hypothetical protein
MTEPIVFISRNRIVEGRGVEFASMFAQGVGAIGSMKPRTALFAAYLDDTGTEVSIVHAFPDAAALTLHFEGSDDRSTSVSRVIKPAGFTIYGRAPAAAVDQLRREAAIGGIGLELFPDPIGGFLRAPS